MKRMQQAAPDGGVLVIKASCDLNISGWDQNIFEIVGDPAGIQIIADDKTTRLTSVDDCDIRVPMHYSVHIEKASGDTWLNDLLGEVKVDKVHGDFSAARIANIAIEKVGGDCSLEEIATPLTCRQIGGDLICSSLAGGLTEASAGGDAKLLNVYGGVRLNAGGDISIGMSDSLGEPVVLRAGGDVVVSIPPSSGWSFDLTSGGNDIRLDLAGKKERIDDWAVLRTEGDGKSPLRVKAGGDIRITDIPLSTEKFQQRAEKMESHRSHVLSIQIPHIQTVIDNAEISADLADRIARKTEAAVRKAEDRIDAAMRKIDQHGSSSRVEYVNSSDNASIPSPDGEKEAGTTVEKPVSHITEEEKLVVLRMLQDNKLTVEEADRLLDALEYTAQ
ncbi:MAG: hypothetical protein ABFD58_11375 [Anaerolineaceae bacterium]